jgi:sugar diacid utilization regulator
MKKLIGLLAISGMVFLSCGPSAEEKAAEEQRIQDSIAQAQADSIAAVEAAAAEAEQQRIQDSIAQAEAAALAVEAATPAKKTSKPAVKKATEPEPAPAPAPQKGSRLQGAKKVS